MAKPVKTGLASYGMSGMVFHAPLLTVNNGFELSHIVERSHKGSKERYPDVAICKSFDELIAVEDLELIIINTPDPTHYDLAKKAINAGKHVVVEKPMSVLIEEAEELVDLAAKKGVLITVFQNRRWDGDFMTVQKILEEGLLGRLVSYEAHFDRYRNFIQQNTWKENTGIGAEILYNLGAHLLDQAFVLFGMPQSISADIGKQRTGTSIDDFFHVVLRYPDLHVTLKSSYLVREEGPRFTLHGTEGSFLKWGIDPQEEALKQGHWPNEPAWGTEERKYWGKLNTEVNGLHFTGRIETYAGNYNVFYDNMAKAIREGGTLAITSNQALDMIRLLNAAIESNRTGKAVVLKDF